MSSLKRIGMLTALLVVGVSLTACGNSSTTSHRSEEDSSLQAENSSLKKEVHNNVVGSYKDDKDGAAITLNSNGTGRYVYADPNNPDTDDQLTWKKDSDGSYTLNLQDSNVTSPLNAEMSGNSLILSGDSNWNTEKFNKVKGNLDLDKFLTIKHTESSSINNSGNATSNASSNAELAARRVCETEGIHPDRIQVTPDGNGGYTVVVRTVGSYHYSANGDISENSSD